MDHVGSSLHKVESDGMCSVATLDIDYTVGGMEVAREELTENVGQANENVAMD